MKQCVPAGPRFVGGPEAWAVFVLFLLPLVVPALGLLLGYSSTPLARMSGLALQIRGGLLPGYPWIDPNAGWTTHALGRLVADEWLHGRIPWWNPFAGLGLPLAAEYQPAAFFLPFVLLLHFDGGGVALRVVLQIIAGLATYALLRQIKLCRFAALAGGCLYELNGTFAWFLDAPIQPLPFLPLLLLGLERAGDAAQARRPGGWGFITVALAASLFAGFPEIALLDGLLGLCWAVRLCWISSAAARPGYVAKVAVGGIAALLIAAPQIVPFLEYLTQAPAQLHLQNGTRGLPTAAALTLLMPYAMGPLAAFSGQDPSGTLYSIWDSVGGYFGTGLTFVAAAGALSRRAPRGLRALLVLWLAVWVARIFAVPGPTQLVNLFPGVSQVAAFRYIEGSCCMALVILAALALDSWRRDGRMPRAALAGAALGVLLAAAASLLAAAPALTNLRGIILPYLWSSIGLSATVLGLLSLLLAGRATPARAAGLGLFMVAEALALFFVPTLSGVRGFEIDRNAVAFLRQNLGLQRVYSLGPLAPNYGSFYQIPELGSTTTPFPASWGHFIASNLDPQASGDFFIGIHPGPLEQRAAALRTNLNNFAASATRFVATNAGFDPFSEKITSDIRPEGAVPRALTAGGETLSGTWTVPHAPGMVDTFAVTIGTYSGQSDGDLSVEICTPKACSRGKASTVGSADNRLRRIPLSPPLPLGDTDVLRWHLAYDGGTRPVAVWYFPGATPDAPSQPDMNLVYVQKPDRPSAVYADQLIDIYELKNAQDYFTADGGCLLEVRSREHLRARCPSTATLTRRELDYPGWRARVNGGAVPVRTIGAVFQAIDLPAGTSDIDFTYRPRFAILTGIAALLGLGVGGMLRRRI